MSAYADTLLVPEDQNGTVSCTSSKLIDCCLDSDNPDVVYKCLPIGSCFGKIAIVPIKVKDDDVFDNTQKINNKIYLCSLKTKDVADWGMMQQNIIEFDDNKNLMDYIEKYNAAGKTYYKGSFCIVDSFYDNTKLYLLFIKPNSNQVDVFELKENGEALKYHALTYKKVLNLLPSNRRIVGLDTIDLRNYTKFNERMMRPALIVAHSASGKFGYKNIFKNSASEISIFNHWDVKDSSDVKGSIEPNFTYKIPQKTNKYFDSRGHTLETQVGGFLTAPTKGGTIGYYFNTTAFMKTQNKNVEITTWVKHFPLQIKNVNKLAFGKIQKDAHSTTNSKFSKMNNDNKVFSKMILENSGIQLISKNDNSLSVNPVDWAQFGSKYHNGNYTIGEVIAKEFESDNNKNILKVAIHKKTKEDPLDSFLRKSQMNVEFLVYGWPYYVYQKGSKTVPPIFILNSATFSTSLTSKGNGVSQDLSFGINYNSESLFHKAKSKLGVKSSFKYMHTKDENHTRSSELTTKINPEKYIGDDNKNCGLIIYSTKKTAIDKYGIFKPKNSKKKLMISGEEAFYPMLTIKYVKNDFNIGIAKFNINEPSTTIDTESYNSDFIYNTKSPRTKGLKIRPNMGIEVGIEEKYPLSAINDKIESIIAFQKECKLDELVRRAKDNIESKYSTGARFPNNDSKSGMKTLNMDYDNSLTFSLSDNYSTIDTFDWSLGTEYEIEVDAKLKVGQLPSAGAGVYAKGNILWNGKDTTTFTEGEGKLLKFDNIMQSTIPTGGRIQTVYLIRIMPSEWKSYNVSKSKKNDKPGFIPDYNWKNNKDFYILFPYFEDTKCRGLHL
jgi:hypothetical protein